MSDLMSSQCEEKERALEKVVVLECDREEQVFPEGGLQAWLTVAGAFLLQYSTFGYTNAFGVFQGWIGSIEIFFVFCSGIVAGRAFDKGYFHHLMIAGGLLHTFSYFMLSLAKPNKYYQVFLAQGLGGGLAIGLMYTPSIAVLSHHFKRKHPLAIGCVLSGTAIGAVLHPILLNRLLASVGFANTVRIAAGINSSLMLIANLMMKTRLPPNQDNRGLRMPIREYCRDIPYVFVLLGGILNIFGFSFPVFFLQLFSVEAIGDVKVASYIISIMNGASVVGRVLPAVASEGAGVLNLLILVEFVMAIFLYALLGIRTAPSMIGFAVTYGIFSGASTTLTPSVIASLARDVDEIGSRIGLSLTLAGVCGLVASPIAGALLTSNYDWRRPIIFAGTTVTTCVVAYAIARVLLVRQRKTEIV